MDLLAAEDGKLATRYDLLAETQKVVANGEQLIVRQTELVALIERQGQDSTRERALLNALTESQALHEQYHQKIVIAFERSRL